MRPPRRAWRRSRPVITVIAAVATLAVLPALVTGAGSAAGAPAAGYTASYIPAGTGSALSIAVNPVTDTVYLGQNSTTTGPELIAVDGATGAILATVALASIPVDIAVDSATDTVYVAIGGSVLVIDGATNSVVATIALPSDANGVANGVGIAVDSTTDTIYVANDRISGGVFVIDGGSDTVTATISSGGMDPYGIGVDEATGTVWVANLQGTVAAISEATGLVIESVSVSLPLYLAVNPATDEVYVASSSGANPLTVIDGADGTTTTVPITRTGTGYVAVDPAADVIFARGGTASGAGLIVIDGATNAVADVLSASGVGAAVDTATGTLYETSSSDEFPGLWAITPSATNGVSPLVSGPTAATATTGTFFATSFSVDAGLPAPVFAETGALPTGVMLAADGVLSGTPATGTAGIYPVTITASNGIAPDYSIPFTLTVDEGAAPAEEALGVEGTNGAMYVQAPQLGSGWHSLGGQITGPPAVAAPPNLDGITPASPLFVATGTNKLLYIRSLTTGWQRLGPAGGACLASPAAVITTNSTGASTLTVACEGTNRALYYNTAIVPTLGLPQFTTPWTNLGGVLTAGPAVAPVGGTLTFFVRGTTGYVYLRTLTTGYEDQQWSCSGAPAAAAQPGTDMTVFACQGTGHALLEDTYDGRWTSLASLGGVLTGAPAVAGASQQFEFFGEGTTRAVYQRTFNTGWTSLGGAVVGGVGAAALN
jgi:YVTN family beta-propeller protein